MEKNHHHEEALISWKQQRPLSKLLSIILIVIILGCIGAIVHIVKIGHGESFTEFYILGLDGKADNYPTEVIRGEEAKVILGIVNHEYVETIYTVDLSIDGFLVNSIGPIELENEGKWEDVVGFKPSVAGKNQRVDFFLYKQSAKSPYLTLYLHINVN